MRKRASRNPAVSTCTHYIHTVYLAYFDDGFCCTHIRYQYLLLLCCCLVIIKQSSTQRSRIACSIIIHAPNIIPRNRHGRFCPPRARTPSSWFRLIIHTSKPKTKILVTKKKTFQIRDLFHHVLSIAFTYRAGRTRETAHHGALHRSHTPSALLSQNRRLRYANLHNDLRPPHATDGQPHGTARQDKPTPPQKIKINKYMSLYVPDAPSSPQKTQLPPPPPSPFHHPIPLAS